MLEMLGGAMEALKLGDPWDAATDVGPVIDAEAEDGIKGYIAGESARGAVLKTLAAPGRGRFVAPTVIAVDGIGAVAREVFGPVLHVAGFRAAGARRGGGRDQRPRLRADLRAAQPDRRPGGAGDGAAARRQRLREPQPDRRHRRLAALRRRGAERHRAEGGRAVLPAPAAARAGGADAGGAGGAGDRGRGAGLGAGGGSTPATGRRAATGWRRSARRWGRPAGWSARRWPPPRRCRRRRSTCRGRPARATG